MAERFWCLDVGEFVLLFVTCGCVAAGVKGEAGDDVVPGGCSDGE
jgi:hypothetical protein